MVVQSSNHSQKADAKGKDSTDLPFFRSDYGNPIGPEGRVIFKIAPDKVNTPRLLGR